MPDSTFLHIQTRGRAPARVVELPGDAVRIGRGFQCEIRLGDPSLAEVECLLRRRGNSWEIQPLGGSGRISIDGRPVDHQRALVPGVPLRVGDHWLTIRPQGAVSPGFGSFETPLSGDIPINPAAVASAVDTDRLGDREYNDPTKIAAPRPVTNLTDPNSGLGAKIRENHDFRERLHHTRREQRQWEARWRAAGESLRNRDATPTPPGPPVPPRPSYPGNSAHTRPSWGQSEPPRISEPDVVEGPRLLIADPVDDLPPENEFWDAETTSEVDERPDREHFAGPAEVILPIAEPEPAKAADPVRETTTPIFNIVSAETEFDANPGEIPISDPQISDAAEIWTPPQPSPVVEPEKPATSSPSPNSVPVRRPRVSRRSSSSSTRAPKTDPPLPEVEDLEWPSARVILAMQPAPAVRVASDRTARKPLANRPVPTESLAPRQWMLPLWLAIIPAAAFLMVGCLGVALAFAWGQDDREAGVLADRLLRADAKPEDLSGEAEGMSEPTWWRTNARHLAMRSAAMGRGTGDADKEEKARFYLGLARNASPLEPSTRLAMAGMQDASGAPPSAIASLGMSRDVLALAWTGRQLARTGRTEAALSVYRQALEITIRSDPSRATTPAFRDENSSRRFALPNEDLIGRIVRAMASQGDWTFERWSAALPDHGLVLLASYRVLSETSSRDAEIALDRLTQLADEPAFGPPAIHRAARAEGLAVKHEKERAIGLYRDAIEATKDEMIRRMWWYNVSEMLKQPEDKTAAIDALNMARAGRGDDEIGRRAGLALAGWGIGKSESKSSAANSRLSSKQR